MELSASASLQPVVDLSFVPPTDNPEEAFDLIAASNLQAEATPEPPSDREATEAEEPEEAADLQDDASDELEEKQEPVEDSEEEIPLEEVLNQSVKVCFLSYVTPFKLAYECLIWAGTTTRVNDNAL